MKCKDCKFWDSEENEYNKDEFKLCLISGKMFVERDDFDSPKNLMLPISEWGDDSWILTGENFGCIHFEEK